MIAALPVGDVTINNRQPGSFRSVTATIGGTSGGEGNPGHGSNHLSMNLGGVNVNFDMGPSTGELTNDAYNFLGNSFNADSVLLGNTIVGSQTFLSGFADPILSMAQQQQDFNTQVLPTMFGTLSAQNYSLGTQAVQAEAEVAKASVASSSASAAQASNSGGFCFITTAVCEARNEPDNGPTLTRLRAFRDGYMQENNVRRAMVEHYYRIAPEIVKRIQQRNDAREFFNSLHTRYIAPACQAIERGQNGMAFTLYTQMVRAAQEA